MIALRLLAARLEAVAGYLEDGLAAGKPPKYLARQAAMAVREIAATARAEAQLEHFPAGTAPGDESAPDASRGWLP